MAINVGGIEASIELNTKGFERAYRRILKNSKEMEKGFDKVGTSVNKVSTKIDKRFTAMGKRITTVNQKITKLGQSSRSGFSKMEKSAVKAQKSITSLSAKSDKQYVNTMKAIQALTAQVEKLARKKVKLSEKSTKANKNMANETKKVVTQIERHKKVIIGLHKRYSRFLRLATYLSAIYVKWRAIKGTVRTFVQIGRVVDEVEELRIRVASATKATGDFNKSWKALVDISKDTGTHLRDTISSFQAIKRFAKEFGATTDDVLKVNKAIAQLGLISGSSAKEIRDGLRQLSQGLSSGVFRAEEINSVLENIPELAVRIANGMGLTVAQLRNAIVEGKILSVDVFEAIIKQTKQINEDAEKIPKTMGRAIISLKIELAKTASEFFERSGLTQKIIDVAQSLEDFVEDFDLYKLYLITEEFKKLAEVVWGMGTQLGKAGKWVIEKAGTAMETIRKKRAEGYTVEIGREYAGLANLEKRNEEIETQKKQLKGTAQRLMWGQTGLFMKSTNKTIDRLDAELENNLKLIEVHQQNIKDATKAYLELTYPKGLKSREEFYKGLRSPVAPEREMPTRARFEFSDDINKMVANMGGPVRKLDYQTKKRQLELKKAGIQLRGAEVAGKMKPGLVGRTEAQIKEFEDTFGVWDAKKYKEELSKLDQAKLEAGDKEELRKKLEIERNKQHYDTLLANEKTYKDALASLDEKELALKKWNEQQKMQMLQEGLAGLAQFSKDAFNLHRASVVGNAMLTAWDVYFSTIEQKIKDGDYLGAISAGVAGFGAIASSIAEVQGLTYQGGRAVGGSVHKGGMYQVNERGPEMLTMGNKNYLMMGGASGKVSPMGGTVVNVNVKNNSNAKAKVQERINNQGGKDIDIIIEQIENRIASSIQRGSSVMSDALETQYGLNRAYGSVG